MSLSMVGLERATKEVISSYLHELVRGDRARSVSAIQFDSTRESNWNVYRVRNTPGLEAAHERTLTEVNSGAVDHGFW